MSPRTIEAEEFLEDTRVREEVAEILREAGVVAYPTDTFYGLGADATNPEAVRRVFGLKGRKAIHPIPVLVENLIMFRSYADNIPPEAFALAEHFWPGPLTIVVESRRFPSEVGAGTGRVGFRVSQSPVAQTLVSDLGSPLTTTSLNRTGEAVARDVAEIDAALLEGIDVIISAGPSASSLPSSVIDVTRDPPLLLREGEIPERLIRKVIGEVRRVDHKRPQV